LAIQSAAPRIAARLIHCEVALVESGRTDEARRAYEGFRGRFSGSAHLEHLSQLVSAGGP
jgi:hypothetical protein